MKKILINLSFLLITGTLLVFFAGCSGDENETDPVNDLLGLWTVSNVEFDAKVGNQSLIDFFINVGGLSEAEAILFYAFFEATFEDEMDGTIDMKADNTYISNFGGSVDDGTWNLSSDGKTLTMDEGTIYEAVFTVNSLTSSMLKITMTEVSTEDLDDDPVTPDVEIVMEIIMTFEK